MSPIGAKALQLLLFLIEKKFHLGSPSPSVHLKMTKFSSFTS